MKKKKAGTLTDEQIRLIDEVVGMRSSVHIREDIEGFWWSFLHRKISMPKVYVTEFCYGKHFIKKMSKI